MCGIFLYIGLNNVNINKIQKTPNVYEEFMKTSHRGPDNSHIIVQNNIFFGFHRLSINDVSFNGDQPFIFNNCVSMCNGEIYNFRDLIIEHKLKCRSKSDCEVIIHLYKKLKREYPDLNTVLHMLCNSLDGEFAFIIYDKTLNKIIVGRDRYGVRPLFIGYNNINDTVDGSQNIHKNIGFSSELKSLNSLFDTVEQFLPSTYGIYDLNTINNWNHIHNNNTKNNGISLHSYNNISEPFDLNNNNINNLLPEIKYTLENAVTKRIMSDVPICALLSGGLDSSLVCAILNKNMPTPLHTFSIGIPGSTDIKYARIVADHIGSIHHEVIVTPQMMLDAIKDVIRITETYDITTIRASTPHYLISRYIRENTDFRVVFSGEMSDECNSSYLYFKKAPDPVSLHNETNRLLNEICYFDNLRADRCISSVGLEARVPFSDHYFIKLIQSINPYLRMCDENIEKYLLRKAFDTSDELLPKEILYRSKAAFSDAVSSYENSWHKIIEAYVDTLITDTEFMNNKDTYIYCTPETKEAYYYRKTYHMYYKHERVIPHFWLPRWCGYQTDPSARELGIEVYNESTNIEPPKYIDSSLIDSDTQSLKKNMLHKNSTKRYTRNNNNNNTILNIKNKYIYKMI